MKKIAGLGILSQKIDGLSADGNSGIKLGQIKKSFFNEFPGVAVQPHRTILGARVPSIAIPRLEGPWQINFMGSPPGAHRKASDALVEEKIVTVQRSSPGGAIGRHSSFGDHVGPDHAGMPAKDPGRDGYVQGHDKIKGVPINFVDGAGNVPPGSRAGRAQKSLLDGPLLESSAVRLGIRIPMEFFQPGGTLRLR
jgi:hypothetical protein